MANSSKLMAYATCTAEAWWSSGKILAVQSEDRGFKSDQNYRLITWDKLFTLDGLSGKQRQVTSLTSSLGGKSHYGPAIGERSSTFTCARACLKLEINTSLNA